ncbi:5'-3' exoribonuclease 2 [Dendrobium catenatum]|uniref:5'-3' exoribonuclease 2 n=1 Tax=Dendrobium catenatum TaxID=906689 RepID=A0A2I0W303_9ASPA|nr:5'-3' exoribonuclease 2 [Dendrobium catenatum]
MQDRSMQQFLACIKSLEDGIAAAGSKIDTEDIVLYIFNGLPSTYNSFKTSIGTSLDPIDLDTLYSLLCSKEINVQLEQSQETNSSSTAIVLYSKKNNTSRGRGLTRYSKGRNSSSRPQYNLQHNNQTKKTTSSPHFDRPLCQICGKIGHIALNCWHSCNLKYAPSTSTPQAL